MGNKTLTDDRIQFPRLLAELRTVGLTDMQYRWIKKSAGLTKEEVDCLLERAEFRWETDKERGE